ncbi:MAG: hypothetical protein LBF97_06065 [Elusimicrobiota bacterium]|jgi:hypothetical protein|nr:hypothetical protein [Elusimicrobiota bacterium]
MVIFKDIKIKEKNKQFCFCDFELKKPKKENIETKIKNVTEKLLKIMHFKDNEKDREILMKELDRLTTIKHFSLKQNK